MPAVFVADGFDGQGNDRAGALVIQDLNKHPNTNGSLGVAWDANRNNAPFLYREVPSTDSWIATMKIDAQSSGQFSYAPIVVRLKGTPPNPVGLGLGDALHANESFVTTGRLRGNTFLIRNIVNGAQVDEIARPLPSGAPLWISLLKTLDNFTTSYSFDGVNYQFVDRVTNNMLHQYGESIQIGPSFMMGGGGEGQVVIDSFSMTTVFVDIFPVPWTGAKGIFGSGEWTDPGNWTEIATNEYPNSKYREVVFSFVDDIIAPVVITNSAAVTVKSISFVSTDTHRIAGSGKISLESNDLTARIIVDRGSHEIELDVALVNKTIAFASPGARLDLDGPLDFMAPGRTLTIDGPGRINFNDDTDLPILGSVINNGHVGGNGRVNASLQNQAGGTVSPGTSAGTLTVDGNYTQDAGATLAIELGGSTAGTFDALNVGGIASLNGTLNVSLADGFVPSVGDSFQILSAGSRVGTFSNTPGDVLNAGLGKFLVTYSANAVTLSSFMPNQVPGDYNSNGVVDAADYVIWRNHLATITPLINEGASPNIVDQADYDFWKANFGKTAGSGATTTGIAAVPEPATFMLLVMSIASAVRIRRS